MLPVDLFKIPIFALSTITAICSFATQGLAFVALPFCLKQGLGRNQIETGFLIIPWPIMVALTAMLAGRLSDRYPAGLLGGVGLATLSLGDHPGIAAGPYRQFRHHLAHGRLRHRLRFFQSPNLRLLMASAPPNRAGGASGVVTVARLLGQTTGAALVALGFSLDTRHGPVLALGIGATFAACFPPSGRGCRGFRSSPQPASWLGSGLIH